MSLIQPTYIPYLANAAAIIAIFPAAIGTVALTRPDLALRLIDFPDPPEKDKKVLTHGLMQYVGARGVAVGLTTLAIWWYGRGTEIGTKLLGVAQLGLTFVVSVDGLVSRKVIGKGEWNHWGFAPVSLGIGVGLLGLV